MFLTFQGSITDNLFLELDFDSDLKLFIVEPENEIFIPMFTFPKSEYPTFVPLSKSDMATDIKIQRKELIRNTKDCLTADAYIGTCYNPNISRYTII